MKGGWAQRYDFVGSVVEANSFASIAGNLNSLLGTSLRFDV